MIEVLIIYPQDFVSYSSALARRSDGYLVGAGTLLAVECDADVVKLIKPAREDMQ